MMLPSGSIYMTGRAADVRLNLEEPIADYRDRRREIASISCKCLYDKDVNQFSAAPLRPHRVLMTFNEEVVISSAKSSTET